MKSDQLYKMKKKMNFFSIIDRFKMLRIQFTTFQRFLEP